MPTADDEHALWASTVEHLSEAFFSNTIRQDTESVHAHAAESEGGLLPEFVVRLVSFFFNDVIEFQGIAIQELDVRFWISELWVKSICEVDHTLAELNSYKHVEVSVNFGE